MWIAFKMYLWHIVYNTLKAILLRALVVNCFQNVSLAYRLQSSTRPIAILHGCELLSKCIFGISFTMKKCRFEWEFWLWIAFKMYLWHIVYNKAIGLVTDTVVVNCFQNVSLAYRLQWQIHLLGGGLCCELLSKCIFGISFTICCKNGFYGRQLWIAFKMYLWHIVYNFLCVLIGYPLVVNCFQNVSLAYRLQFKDITKTQMSSCELLSKCIFGISFTMVGLDKV